MGFKAAPKDEKIVQAIADDIIGEIGKPGNPPDTPELNRFFRIFSMDLEIGSGANFDQYFDWTSSSELKEIITDLSAVGLQDHALVAQKAIEVAFPSGIIPEFEAASLDMDWTEVQTEKLGELYRQVSHLHGAVTRQLAKYVADHSLIDMPRFSGVVWDEY